MRRRIVHLLCLSLLTGPIHAENPFEGGNGQPPGNPPPTDPSDFEAEEFPEEGDFGFTPPPNTQPPPPVVAQPPSNDSAPSYSPPPSRSAPSPRTFTPPKAVSSPSPSSPSSPTFKSASSPRLADYLELDSTIKGLEVKNFDLPDKEIRDVVTLISKWTGKNFILDSKVRGKITILGPSQVTLQEAYAAFLSALEANGLTTVQSGKFIRVIESAEARRAPVKTYAGEFAPKDDQFITRIIQLKYINADEVQKEFRDMTTRQGKLFAYEPTNSLIITDTGSNIQRIKEILDVLDIKGFETTLHVLKMKYGSAKGIAEMLAEIYGDDKSKPGAPRTFRRTMLERTRGGGVISKIIPDETTNSLVVLANSAGYAQLQQLVARLDVRSKDTGRIHVYYCEHAKAEDLAATLASLSGGGGGTPASRNRRGSTPSPAGGPGAAGPAGPISAELEGGVKITSDAATNALVVTANSSDYQVLKRVIKKLDIPRLQVFVETAILEISLDNTDKVGVNAALGAPGRGFAGGFIGDGDTLTSVLASGAPAPGATIPIFAGSSFPAKIANTDVTVTSFMGLINLITTETNSSVLSTPQIIALDNQKAEFKVQDNIPISKGVQALPAGANSNSLPNFSIEYQKVGIDIKLTPHINAASRQIQLEIEQTVDSLKKSDIPSALSTSTIATTSRHTNTTVNVKDRDFIALGGLMSDKSDEKESKVPLLGDIPVLGWLFKTKTWESKKTNLVILLHPRIIGTTLEGSQIISKQMKKRDQFINKHFGGDDIHHDDVKELKSALKEQEKRGMQESGYDYRNNDVDEVEDEEQKDTPVTLPEEKTSLRSKEEIPTLSTSPSQESLPTQDSSSPLGSPEGDLETLEGEG